MPHLSHGKNILLVVLFILFQSCGKKIGTPSVETVAVIDTIIAKDTTTLIEIKPAVEEVQPIVEEPKVHTEDLNFNYIKAKSKVLWKTNSNSDTYTVDIRMKKDSLIWMNISVSMITGATGIFSKDRVQFFHKINNEYFNLTYDSLSTKMGFKINYEILQSLIVGNQPFKKNNSRVIRENENYILKQDEGRIQIDNYVGPNRKLKKLLVNDGPTENKLTLDYEDFATINQFLFPFSSQITLDVKDKDNKVVKTLISIKYSKVELLDSPLEFPFKVPAKYLNK
ncbi:DUF4292 domain-containing protein [Aquirufa ecclesiirivi]|uniref:DUF4292 domain-containing protein n=1 Tax=Aquirufa ecclesiirivi TaxID=2715124 RepID=A0ABT4JH65_9BACT|nr:DUF4292 domain-containing protein [Aquirufa ecclesiirivi]MCZ2475624.1 DUF4292 domain-containing protein [Aquirufa ecclesiirivi]NHC48934.1 DUF4292 domain-containing protein [Aquirufa ecclesiirivi]